MTLRLVLVTKIHRACTHCSEPLKRGYFHKHSVSPRKGRGKEGSK